VFRVGVLVAMALLAVSGCLRPEVEALASAAGCRGVATAHDHAELLLWVSARECARGREVRSAAESFDLLVAMAWRAPGPEFNRLRVTIFRSAEEPRYQRALTIELPRDALTAR
jgi:hypothetical protein